MKFRFEKEEEEKQKKFKKPTNREFKNKNEIKKKFFSSRKKNPLFVTTDNYGIL